MSNTKLDWSLLYSGAVSPQEVQEAIRDPEWQELRRDLKGTGLATKYYALLGYENRTELSIQQQYRDGLITSEDVQRLRRLLYVRTTNYVTALSRGGLIKTEDYR